MTMIGATMKSMKMTNKWTWQNGVWIIEQRLYIILACLIFCITTYADVSPSCQKRAISDIKDGELWHKSFFSVVKKDVPFLSNRNRREFFTHYYDWEDKNNLFWLWCRVWGLGIHLLDVLHAELFYFRRQPFLCRKVYLIVHHVGVFKTIVGQSLISIPLDTNAEGCRCCILIISATRHSQPQGHKRNFAVKASLNLPV